MDNEFEPFTTLLKNSEFSTWEFNGIDSSQEEIQAQQEKHVDELEQLKQEAYEKAYAEGLAKAESDINNKLSELQKWIELIQKPVKLIDEQLVQEFIQTIIWLCHHCIGIELSVEPDKLKALFEEIKKELPSLTSKHTLGLHPEDFVFVQKEISEKELPGINEALFADPNLGRGDFYLKSEHSELDGRIQSRLISLFSQYLDRDNLITPIKSQD